MSRRIMWSKDGTWFSGGYPPNTKYLANPSYPHYYDAAEYTFGSSYNLESCFNSRYPNRLIWNFPDVVSLTEFRWSLTSRYGNSGSVLNFESCPSGDTSNGIDGTWVSVGTARSILPTYTANSVVLNAPSTRWFRIRIDGTSWPEWLIRDWYIQYMALYGSYDTEDFVLWDNEPASAPITDWTDFLTLPNAADNQDFAPDNKQFKIENITDTEHTYTITLESGRNPFNDPLIVNNWLASKDGGVTQSTVVQTAPVPPGFFSEVIDLEYFMTAISNPKDGYHWFRVLVKEDIV